METGSGKTSVFEYSDYRKFLHDFYKAKKAEATRFSHRYIAQKVGFRSSGFFTLILQGKTNISGEMIRNFIDFLKLSKREAEYFETLVYFNQARTHTEKKRYFEKLTQFKRSVVSQIDSSRYAYYEKWYYSAIRELLHFHPFRGDDVALSRLLIPSITPGETRKAIRLLLRLGFITKDVRGYYRRSDAESTTTGPHVQSLAVENFQLKTIALASEAMNRFPRSKRNLSTVTFSFTEKNYPALEEEIRIFRRRILELAEANRDDDIIYQLNLQLFPLTRRVGDNNS